MGKVCFCQFILEAKVHAIRDAQLVEKAKIQKELEDEETRLDRAMETERINAIKIQEGIDQKRKDERMLGAMQIMDQIRHNEQVCLQN